MAGLYRTVFNNCVRHDLYDWSAALAFYFLFALFPAILFTAALLSTLHMSGLMANLVWGLSRDLPGPAASMVSLGLTSLLQHQVPVLLSAGTLLLLYSASEPFFGLMTALNCAYEVHETRSWLYRVGLSLVLAFTAGILLAVELVVAIVGRRLLDFIAGPSHSVELMVNTWVWPEVRWAILVPALFAAVMLVYSWAPNVSRIRRGIVLAAAHATFLGLAATALLAFYMDHFSQVSRIYGALGAMIALMLWLYVIAAALMFGAEFHAEWLRRRGVSLILGVVPQRRRAA